MNKKKIKECQIFWIQEIACSQEDIGEPNKKDESTN